MNINIAMSNHNYYEKKYIKYKNKYLQLQLELKGGESNEIIDMIKNNKLDDIKEILKNISPTDLNKLYDIDSGNGRSDKNTLLVYAIEMGHQEIVTELLKQSAIDVNMRGIRGLTPLMMAIDMKHDEIAKELLKHKDINVNLQSDRGSSALILAIKLKRTEIVKKLLQRNDIDVNLYDNTRNSALIAAVERKHLDVVKELDIIKEPNIVKEFDTVKELLKHVNINVNFQNKKGMSALMIAINKNMDESMNEIINELLQRKDIDINLQNNKGDTALQYAIIGYDIHTVKELLKRDDIDINLKDNDGNTVLHIALIKYNIDIIKELLKRNDINVNLQNNEGLSALILAVIKQSDEIVKELLKRNDININLQDNKGETALMFAVVKQSDEIVKELLKRNDINVNLQKDRGNSALMLINQDVEGLKILKELVNHRNIDLNLRNNNGYNAYDYSDNKDINEFYLFNTGIEIPSQKYELLQKGIINYSAKNILDYMNTKIKTMGNNSNIDEKKKLDMFKSDYDYLNKHYKNDQIDKEFKKKAEEYYLNYYIDTLDEKAYWFCKLFYKMDEGIGIGVGTQIINTMINKSIKDKFLIKQPLLMNGRYIPVIRKSSLINGEFVSSANDMNDMYNIGKILGRIYATDGIASGIQLSSILVFMILYTKFTHFDFDFDDDQLNEFIEILIDKLSLLDFRNNEALYHNTFRELKVTYVCNVINCNEDTELPDNDVISTFLIEVLGEDFISNKKINIESVKAMYANPTYSETFGDIMNELNKNINDNAIKNIMFRKIRVGFMKRYIKNNRIGINKFIDGFIFTSERDRFSIITNEDNIFIEKNKFLTKKSVDMMKNIFHMNNILTNVSVSNNKIGGILCTDPEYMKLFEKVLKVTGFDNNEYVTKEILDMVNLKFTESENKTYKINEKLKEANIDNAGEMLCRFIKFVTSGETLDESDVIKIDKKGDVEICSAHTCFKKLVIPSKWNDKDIKGKLFISMITSSNEFNIL
jgi:ankyrin repeat protein